MDTTDILVSDDKDYPDEQSIIWVLQTSVKPCRKDCLIPMGRRAYRRSFRFLLQYLNCTIFLLFFSFSYLGIRLFFILGCMLFINPANAISPNFASKVNCVVLPAVRVLVWFQKSHASIT